MRFSLSVGALSALFVLARAQQTPDSLQKYTLTAPGINASYISYGARLTNLYVNDRDGKPQDVVLGYDQGSGYLHDTEHEYTYFGAVGTYLPSVREKHVSRYDDADRTIRPQLGDTPAGSRTAPSPLMEKPRT